MVLKTYADLLLDELSGKIAKNYVVEISKFHRIAVSPGFYEAVMYVKKELEQIGLERITIEEFPADGKTKAWTRPVRKAWRLEKGELRMVNPRDEILARTDESPSRVVGYSKKADVVAEVVDVGEGSDSDFKGKDVEGKIVLIATDKEMSMYKKATKHGAIGMLIYPPFYRAADYPDMLRTDAFYASLEDIENDKVPFGFAISTRQAEMIKNLMKEKKTVEVHAKVDAEFYDGVMHVLSAQITGAEKPEEEVVLVAHLCHFVTCSNDNASGSGTIMEVARAIKKLIDKGLISRPKRTIRFLWVPEGIGTTFWMHRYPDTVRHQLAALNLDMVGEHPVRCGMPINIIEAPESIPNYLNDLVSYILDYVGDHPKGVEPLEGWKFGLDYRIEKYSGGSDHVWLTDSYFGVPTVMFDNPDQFHHMSLDTPDKVDTSKLQRIGVVSGATVLTIANADEDVILALASLVRRGGYSRISKTTSEVIEELLSISGSARDNARLKIGTSYVRGMLKIELAMKREARNVLSVERLGVTASVRSLADGFDKVIETEKEKIKAIYRTLCTRLHLEPVEEERDEEVLKTMKLVPKKEFEGLSPKIDSDKLTQEDREWLEEVDKVHNPSRNYILVLDGVTIEFMNFVDGKRTIYDIAMLVNTEYGNIEPAEAKRFFDIYKGLGFISYTENI